MFLRKECSTLRKFIVDVLGKRLEDAKLAIATSSNLTDTFKAVNELESDLARAVDEFEILRKQAHDLHPL